MHGRAWIKVVLLTAVCAAPGCTGTSGAGLSVAEVTRQSISRTVVLTGTVYPNERAPVWPEVAGRVTRVHVTRGALVAKGDPLLEIDSSRALLDVDQRTLAVARAELAVERARDALLAPIDKPASVLTRELGLAELELKLARRLLADSHLQLRQHTVVAPRAGVVVQANVRVGQLVGPGSSDSSAFLSLADDNGVHVEAEGDEFDVAGLDVGSRAELFIDAIGEVLSVSVTQPPALIRTRTAGMSSSVFLVRLGGLGSLPPSAWGMTARVRVVLESASDVPSVPIDFVQTRGDLRFVTLADSDEALEVSLGLCDSFACEVKTGPPLGTKIVRRAHNDSRN